MLHSAMEQNYHCNCRRKAILELAEILGISTRAVEKQIARLRQNGQLRRIGSARGGIGRFLDILQEVGMGVTNKVDISAG